MAQWLKNLPAVQETQGYSGLISGLGRSPVRGKWQPTPVFFPENSKVQANVLQDALMQIVVLMPQGQRISI